MSSPPGVRHPAGDLPGGQRAPCRNPLSSYRAAEPASDGHRATQVKDQQVSGGTIERRVVRRLPLGGQIRVLPDPSWSGPGPPRPGAGCHRCRGAPARTPFRPRARRRCPCDPPMPCAITYVLLNAKLLPSIPAGTTPFPDRSRWPPSQGLCGGNGGQPTLPPRRGAVAAAARRSGSRDGTPANGRVRHPPAHRGRPGEDPAVPTGRPTCSTSSATRAVVPSCQAPGARCPSDEVSLRRPRAHPVRSGPWMRDRRVALSTGSASGGLAVRCAAASPDRGPVPLGRRGPVTGPA